MNSHIWGDFGIQSLNLFVCIMPPSKSQSTPSSSKGGSGSICHAFFSGEIKDRTTKESRKAADNLAVLKTIKKNPAWTPADNKSKMLKKSSGSLSSSDLAKMRMQIGDTVPSEVVTRMTSDLAEACTSLPASSAASSSVSHLRSPMLLDVEAEIHRRIHALGKSGKMFEDNAMYVSDQQLAADAEFLVRGIDPQVLRRFHFCCSKYSLSFV